MPGDGVVLVSQDTWIIAEVRRLAAMAGRVLHVAGCWADATRELRLAAMVIVDAGHRLDGSTPEPRPPALRAEVVVVAGDLHRVDTWREAVRLGARRVLSLPGDAAELLDLLALAAEHPGPPGALLGVVGGHGGAGASTLAVALGWAVARKGPAVTLVDLDPLGGGLDIALGLERCDGLRWPDLVSASGVVAAAALRAGLPAVDGLAVVSAGRFGTASDVPQMPGAAAVTAVIAAARRGGGVVVADLPRWPTDATDRVVADCDVVLLVSSTEVRAVAAASGVGARLGALTDDVRTVVRAERRARLHPRDVVTALGHDHLVTVRSDPGASAAADRGELTSWLRRSRLGAAACELADRLVDPVGAGG